MKPSAAVAVLALIIPLAFVGGAARAQSWCADATVFVEPAFYPAGISTSYSIVIANTGTSPLNVTRVAVRFSFEASERVLSTGLVTIAVGASRTFDTPSVTAAAGGFTVLVSVDGYPQNNPADTGRCTSSHTIQDVDVAAPSLFSGMVVLIVMAAVVLVIIVVAIVAVIVLVARPKGPRPPAYPPVAPPPYGPPPAPPTPPTR